MNENIPVGYDNEGEWIGSRDPRAIVDFKKKMDEAEDIYTEIKDEELTKNVKC